MGRQKKPSRNDDGEVVVRRGRVASVDIYEIKDTELDELERGSPVELQLNFAIFCISTSISGILTLVTGTFSNPKTETGVLITSIACSLLGAYLILVWTRGRGSVKKTCKRIRARIRPDLEADMFDVIADSSIPEKLDEENESQQ